MARTNFVRPGLIVTSYLLYCESRAALSERQKADMERETARAERKCSTITCSSMLILLDAQFQELLVKLSPYDFHTKHSTLRETRVVNTGRWFLEDEKFAEWVYGDNSILWCPGIGIINSNGC